MVYFQFNPDNDNGDNQNVAFRAFADRDKPVFLNMSGTVTMVLMAVVFLAAWFIFLRAKEPEWVLDNDKKVDWKKAAWSWQTGVALLASIASSLLIFRYLLSNVAAEAASVEASE